VSLRDRVITEYGGIGGRVAGARHPHSVPPPASINHDQMSPERAEKLSRREDSRRKTRDYLRQLALEGRRPLKALGG